MAKIGMFLVLVAAVGCGGPSFTVGFKEIDQADSGSQADALAAAGGAPTVGSGGKVGLSAGGQPSSGGADSGGTSSGGAPSSGGLSGSGGAVDVDGGHDSGGATGVGGEPADACVLVTHSTGLGQTWQDCVPLGTYNEEQAMKACEAWCASGGNCIPCTSGGRFCEDSETSSNYIAGAITTPRSTTIAGWAFAGSNVGHTMNVNPSNALSCAQNGMWD
jgi:hypothetical protein